MNKQINHQPNTRQRWLISRLFFRNVALLGLTTILLGSGTTGYTQPISKSLLVPTVTNRSTVERFNLDFYSEDFKNIKITYDAGDLFKQGIELEKSGNLQEANTIYQLALETAKKNGTNFRLRSDEIGKIFNSFSTITITYNTPSGSVNSLKITPPYFQNNKKSPSYYRNSFRPLIERIMILEGFMMKNEHHFGPPYYDFYQPTDVFTWILQNKKDKVSDEDRENLMFLGYSTKEINQINKFLKDIQIIKEKLAAKLAAKFPQSSDKILEEILERSLQGKGSYEDLQQVLQIAVDNGLVEADSSKITEWLKEMGIGLDCSGFAAYVLNQLLPNPNPVWGVVVTESDIQEFTTSYTNIDVSKSIILQLEFLAFNPEMTSSGTFKERLNIDFANVSSPLDLVPGTIMYQPGHVRIVESVKNTEDGIEFTTVEWRSNEQEPNKRRDWRYPRYPDKNQFGGLQLKSGSNWSVPPTGIAPSVEFLLYKPLKTFYNDNMKMILQSIGNYDIVAINPIPPSAGISQAVQDALLKQDWQQVANILSQDNNLMTNPIARLLMGHAELELNKNNESLQYFRSTNNPSDLKQWTAWTERLKEQNPNSSLAFYLSGDAKVREGNSQPCSVQSSNNYWANSPVLMANGKVLVKKSTQFFLSAKPCDHLEEALKDFNQALALDPNFALAYNARGVLYALKQKWNNAYTDLSTAIALDPNLADAYVNLGTLSVLQESSINLGSGALDAFGKALAINPEFALAYNNRGSLYLGNNEVEKARSDFHQVQTFPLIADLFLENQKLLADVRKPSNPRDLLDGQQAPGGIISNPGESSIDRGDWKVKTCFGLFYQVSIVRETTN